MRTRTNLFFISLLCSACTSDLPPSPYGGTGGQSTDPINPVDGGAADAAPAEDAAAPDGGAEDDAGEPNDAGQPDLPPLVPKTDCDPEHVLDREFDPLSSVGLASNGKGGVAVSWTNGEPRKQYASTFRDNAWESKQQLASDALKSATLGIDDLGGTYAFWWGETGLTGRKLETDDKSWGGTEELDKDAEIPVRPLPYVVSANGTCLFVRDDVSARSVVRYASDLSFQDEQSLDPPTSSYEQEQLTHLLTDATGQAVVLTTWRKSNERQLVPYFQDSDELNDADALTIEESVVTEQLAGVVVPSGDLAVVALEATDKDGRLWLRRVTRADGNWSKETEIEDRNIEGRRFALRAALADARGLLTVAWIDGEDVRIAQEGKEGFGDPITAKVDDPESAVFALDRDGNLSMAYADNRGLSLRQLSARDGKLSPSVPLTSHVPAFALVTHDADDNVIVVWEEDGLRTTTCREQTVGE